MSGKLLCITALGNESSRDELGKLFTLRFLANRWPPLQISRKPSAINSSEIRSRKFCSFNTPGFIFLEAGSSNAGEHRIDSESVNVVLVFLQDKQTPCCDEPLSCVCPKVEEQKLSSQTSSSMFTLPFDKRSVFSQLHFSSTVGFSLA